MTGRRLAAIAGAVATFLFVGTMIELFRPAITREVIALAHVLVLFGQIGVALAAAAWAYRRLHSG